MAQLKKKLIRFKTKQEFVKRLANGDILPQSVIFIQDTHEIWTHGENYSKVYLLNLNIFDSAEGNISDEIISEIKKAIDTNQIIMINYGDKDGEDDNFINSYIACFQEYVNSEFMEQQYINILFQNEYCYIKLIIDTKSKTYTTDIISHVTQEQLSQKADNFKLSEGLEWEYITDDDDFVIDKKLTLKDNIKVISVDEALVYFGDARGISIPINRYEEITTKSAEDGQLLIIPDEITINGLFNDYNYHGVFIDDFYPGIYLLVEEYDNEHEYVIYDRWEGYEKVKPKEKYLGQYYTGVVYKTSGNDLYVGGSSSMLLLANTTFDAYKDGFVPAPNTFNNLESLFLRADGKWEKITKSDGSSVDIPLATPEKEGLMSATDKQKIDDELKPNYTTTSVSTSKASPLLITSNYKKRIYRSFTNSALYFGIVDPSLNSSNSQYIWNPGQSTELWITYIGSSTAYVDYTDSSSAAQILNRSNSKLKIKGLPVTLHPNEILKLEILYDGSNWIITNCNSANHLSDNISFWGQSMSPSAVTQSITGPLKDVGSITPRSDGGSDIGEKEKRFKNLYIGSNNGYSNVTISSNTNGYNDITSGGLNLNSSSTGGGIVLSGSSASGCYIKMRLTGKEPNAWNDANAVISLNSGLSNVKTNTSLVIAGADTQIENRLAVNYSAFGYTDSALEVGKGSLYMRAHDNIGAHIKLPVSGTDSAYNESQIVWTTLNGEDGRVAISGVDKKLCINPYIHSNRGQVVLGVDGEDSLFTSTGNVGIGTEKPTQKLHVEGQVYTWGLRLPSQSNGFGAISIDNNNNSLTIVNTLENKNVFIDGSLRVGCNYTEWDNSYKLQVGGNVKCVSLTGAVSSDIRLKENIASDNYIDKINSLGDVVDYNYTKEAIETHEFLDDKKHTGLIYQNVKDIDIPNISAEDGDGHGFVNYYSPDLIATMIGAIQQLSKKVEDLENEIKTLKNEKS